MNELETAREILKKLNSNGYPSYIVGGYVRDKLLGIDSNDIDIATKARPKNVLNIFDKVDIKDEEYGTARVFANGYCFELTTFRDELNYRDKRHPTVSFIADIADDLKRRDFTINAMAEDLDGNIIDLFNGKDDLKKGIVRSVGDSTSRFMEDALRILRAFYFAAKLNFKIENDTLSAITNNSNLILNLKSGAIRGELKKIFDSQYPDVGINYLVTTGVAKVLGLEETLLKAEKLSIKLTLKELISSSLIFDTLMSIDPINEEKRLISLYKKNKNTDLSDNYTLYSLTSDELSSLAKLFAIHDNKKYSVSDLLKRKSNLVINSRNEFMMSTKEIIDFLGYKPGPWLNKLLVSIEHDILDGKLKNTKEAFILYLKDFEKSNKLDIID